MAKKSNEKKIQPNDSIMNQKKEDIPIQDIFNDEAASTMNSNIQNQNTAAYKEKEGIKGDPQMQKAYQAASKINRSLIEKESPEDLKYLKELKDSDIIITRGQYDHGEVIFELCSIPYSLIDTSQLASIQLRDDQILFINCPGYIDDRGIERIKSFVLQGGMLVTTDWSLKNVLEKMFPNLLRYNNRATADDVVRVVFEPVNDTFLKGLLDPKDEPVWWLEGSSYPIELLDASKITVLVSSKEMKEKYGESPIVIAFEFGKGKVYHMTSHFYLQRAETRSKRQGMAGVSYAAQKGLSMDIFTDEEAEALGDVTVAQTEAAYTSARSISNIVIEQKKRAEMREKEK